MKGYIIDFKNNMLSSISQDQYFKDVFEIVDCVDVTNKIMYDFNKSFSYKKSFYLEDRPISIEEIGIIFSHKSVYKKIAENNKINRNDFVLVAEDSIVLIDDWYRKINLLINAVNDVSHIKVISLQISNIHNFDKFVYDDRFDVLNIINGKEFDLFKQNNISRTRGSSLYLIRKSEAIRLAKIKREYLYVDFWEFRLRGSNNIMYTNPVFAYSKDVESDDLKNHKDIYLGISGFKITKKLKFNLFLNKYFYSNMYRHEFIRINKLLSE